MKTIEVGTSVWVQSSVYLNAYGHTQHIQLPGKVEDIYYDRTAKQFKYLVSSRGPWWKLCVAEQLSLRNVEER